MKTSSVRAMVESSLKRLQYRKNSAMFQAFQEAISQKSFR